MNKFSVAQYDPVVYEAVTVSSQPRLAYEVSVSKYLPQIKYNKSHPEKMKEIHARYLEKHRDDYNAYHRLYERDRYEWSHYIHNTKYKYEKKLFLNILLPNSTEI